MTPVGLATVPRQTAGTRPAGPAPPPAADSQSRKNARGAAFLAFGVFIFSFQDVIVKWVSGGAYPVHEIVFIRSIVALPIVTLIAWWDVGFAGFTTRRIGLQVLRGLLAFTCFTTYYLAIAAMPLAEVVAITFSSPLVIIMLSMLFLKERVGIDRILAVLVGFAGVLLITRPGSSVFEPAALIAVLSAIAYGFNAMLARVLGPTEQASIMSFYSTIVYLGVSAGLGLVLWQGTPVESTHPSLAFMSRPWAMPTAVDFGLISITGVISAFGFYCLAQAYRTGEASVVAPFEYTSMLWATLLGLVIFAEVPGPMTIAGMALIVGAGLFVIWRDVSRRAAPAPARRKPAAVRRRPQSSAAP